MTDLYSAEVKKKILRCTVAHSLGQMLQACWLKPFWLKCFVQTSVAHTQGTGLVSDWCRFVSIREDGFQSRAVDGVIRRCPLVGSGPRPKSMQWPLAKEHNLSGVPQRRCRWIQPQLLKEGRVPRPANPDEAVKAARVRVQRVESALAALGESDSVESRALQRALKFAQRASEDKPVVQVKECEAFTGRSQNRLAHLEKERAKERSRHSTIAKTSRIGFRRSSDAATTSCSSGVRCGSGDRAFARSGGRVGGDQHDTGASSRAPTSFRVWRRRVHLYLWIEDRQTDLREALVDGNSTRVLELTSKMAEGAEQLREITCSRMGRLLGCRVGEASNPGPVQM